MTEKILVLCLIVCTGIGMIGGPYMWQQTSIPERASEKKEVEKEKTELGEGNRAAAQGKEIRVLLSNQNLGEYIHKKVVITSEEPYYKKKGNRVFKKQAGKKTVLHFKKNQEGKVVTFSGTGKLKILSYKRSYGYPVYRGRMEVHYGKNGFFLINELLLDEYLYAVIPSEMPISYGIEALKVQAVCARTFALKQIQGQKFQSYGADVDDSVASQVYNNSRECRESIKAAVDTAGEVLTYQRKPVSTYFFSTSWGHTADSHDVWIQKGKSPVYLRGSLQKKEKVRLDLSKEERVKKFLVQEKETYDSDFPWYRWNVEIPYRKLSTGNLGKVTNVQVVKRAKSGVVKSLRITGKKGVREIYGEYKIRTWLSPGRCTVIRQDGSRIRYSKILPSGCFVIEKKRAGILLSGGGYGHGVGMSQNGAKKQADLGKNYKEILQYYYPDTEILKQKAE